MISVNQFQWLRAEHGVCHRVLSIRNRLLTKKNQKQLQLTDIHLPFISTVTPFALLSVS
jgi:hypothetical protein